MVNFSQGDRLLNKTGSYIYNYNEIILLVIETCTLIFNFNDCKEYPLTLKLISFTGCKGTQMWIASSQSDFVHTN